MTAYPLIVALPDGSQARVRIIHVVVINDKGEAALDQLMSSPPQYERRDGTTVELNVTIPDDLVEAGWYWFGSTLAHRDGLVFIHTATYGLPGVFAQARLYEAKREVMAIQRVERAAVPPKKQRPTKQPPSAPATAQQLAMEF